jgi:hypothetical protein
LRRWGKGDRGTRSHSGHDNKIVLAVKLFL